MQKIIHSLNLLSFLIIAAFYNVACLAMSKPISLSQLKIERFGSIMTHNANQMGSSFTTIILAIGTSSILLIAGKEQNKTIAAIGAAGILPLLYSINNDNNINTKLLENNRRLAEDVLKVQEEESPSHHRN